MSSTLLTLALALTAQEAPEVLRVQNRVVLDDEFDNNKNKWPTYRTDRFKTKITKGAYEMYTPFGRQMVTKPTRLDFTQDFDLTLKIRLKEGPKNHGFGLSFAGRSARYVYYFYIAADGHYKIAYFDDRPSQDIVKWTKSKYVKKGYNKDNDLRIERRSGDWIFYINGRQVQRLRAERGFGNKIGFGVAGKGMKAYVTAIRATQITRVAAPPPVVSQPPPVAIAPPPPPPAHEKPRRIVAVFDIEDRAKRMKKRDLEQLSEYLEALIAGKGTFAVVPRTQIKSTIADAKKKSYDACYDEACQIELGKAVAAEAILSTKIVKIGSRCAVTTSLFDLKREVTIRAATERGKCSTDDLVGLLDKVADRI